MDHKFASLARGEQGDAATLRYLDNPPFIERVGGKGAAFQTGKDRNQRFGLAFQHEFAVVERHNLICAVNCIGLPRVERIAVVEPGDNFKG